MKKSLTTSKSIMNNDHHYGKHCRTSLQSQMRTNRISTIDKQIQLIALSVLFCGSWLLWPWPSSSTSTSILSSFISKSCIQVQAYPIKPSPSPSLSLSSLSSMYGCNITVYPENNGCHPLQATCDPESQLCICSNLLDDDKIYGDDHDSDNNNNDNESKKQRHYQHKRIDIYQCLPRKKIGQKCQHSAQCYSMITGSGCYRQQQQQQQKRKQSLNVDNDQWHCSCAFGYKGMCDNE